MVSRYEVVCCYVLKLEAYLVDAYPSFSPSFGSEKSCFYVSADRGWLPYKMSGLGKITVLESLEIRLVDGFKCQME